MQRSDGPTWRHFTAAPHRMLFFGGVCALVLSMLWWGVILAGRAGLLPVPPLGLPPTWAHAWLMVYGIFPFFVLGFLLTAFVRWIGAPLVPRRLYQPIALGLCAGYLLVLGGTLISIPFAAVGMAATALAWLAGAIGLARRLRAHRPAGSSHPPWALLFLVIGWSGAVLSAWGAASGNWALLAVGPRLGVWGFLAPLVFVVGHRMLPFFAQAALPGYAAYRPAWAPPLAALLFLAHTGLLVTGLSRWLWLVDLPLAGLTGWLLWCWRPWRARGNPLLWSLFAAFAWMPIAVALSGLQSLILVVTGSLALGRAPLHALAIGCLTSMVVAMATRVSQGHAGRPLHMNRISLTCFLMVQLTAVVRVLAEVPLFGGLGSSWLVLSAVLWLLAVVPWAGHYGVVYWQPRRDGQPG